MKRGWSIGSRELSRRRMLLVAISGLTVLATLPVVGHHIVGGGANLLDGRDNIGDLCLVALHALLAPVHYGFHVALVIGVLYATSDRVRAWFRLRQVTAKMQLEPVPANGPFAEAFTAAGVDRQRAVIIAGLPNPAFTAGWWRPRIYLAAELAGTLSTLELQALIVHEAAHLERRDPLRLAVLRFFACLVFWLPALRRLAEDVTDEAEFEADDIASRGRPLVLASAILSVALLGGGDTAPKGAVAFAGPGLIEQRVRRLSGEPIEKRSHVTTRSLAAAAAMLLFALASGIVMAHPLASEPLTGSAQSADRTTHAGHKGKCSEHEGLAVLHLFCGGLPFGIGGTDCPHHSNSAAPLS